MPTARKTPRLLLVDDHPMWRVTLRNILMHAKAGNVVGEASDGDEAVALARELKPDVVVMDVNLPEIDGIEATRRLDGIKVLVLASSDERSQVADAIRAGARGYLLKTAAPDEVVDAVRRIARGELVFPASIAGVVLDELRGPGTLRVVVADEAVLAREGLVRVLREIGFDVRASVGDAAGLEAAIEEHGPDVVVVDAGMPASARSVPMLVLATEAVVSEVSDLLGAGAGGIGYLLKKRIANLDEFEQAVRRVARGEAVVDPQVVSALVSRPKQQHALNHLTAREREVLALMAEGHSNRAIVEKLFLGPKTIEAHVRSIFSKLGLEQDSDVHRRVAAVIAYLRPT
jgi:DNA-binding NarL/FixJ family response regulator